MRAEADVARAAHEAAREWAAPRLHELRQAAVSAGQRVDDVDARIAAVEAELIALRGGVDAAPALPAFSTAQRDSASGAAFYQLVDFAPSLPAGARAGLEAALQASPGCWPRG